MILSPFSEGKMKHYSIGMKQLLSLVNAARLATILKFLPDSFVACFDKVVVSCKKRR